MRGSEYTEFAAPTALGPFLECFWTHRHSQRLSRVLPDTCIDIVFSRSTGLQIAGTMTRPLLAPAAGDVFAGARFRAAMARQFIGTVATELADRVLPLNDVWGRRGRELEEQLRNASGAEEMLSSLQAVLKPPSEVSPVQNAIEFLARNAGSVSLKRSAAIRV